MKKILRALRGIEPQKNYKLFIGRGASGVSGSGIPNAWLKDSNHGTDACAVQKIDRIEVYLEPGIVSNITIGDSLFKCDVGSGSTLYCSKGSSLYLELKGDFEWRVYED